MAQFATVPVASRTSMKKNALGLAHSILVTIPWSFTCLPESYVAEKGRCENMGAAEENIKAVIVRPNTALFIVFTLVPGESEITAGRPLCPGACEFTVSRAKIIDLSLGRDV